MKPPRVSVVMPVFNAADYVADAVESILGQTYCDFEFIVVDDGSSDRSPAILEEFSCRDRRIRVLRRETNLGVAASLNEGLDAARGEYICRMDADDVSRPGRLGQQVAFLDRHLEIGVLGTATHCFGAGIDRIWRLPRRDGACRARLVFSVPVAHPTAMIRRSLLEEHGFRYRAEFKCAEDYDLWERMMDVTQFANLNEVLLDYRYHRNSVSKAAEAALGSERFEIIYSIAARVLERLGICLTPDEAYVHYCLGLNERVLRAGISFEPYARHLARLNASRSGAVVPRRSMHALVARRYVMITYLLILAGSPREILRNVCASSFWRGTGRLACSFLVVRNDLPSGRKS